MPKINSFNYKGIEIGILRLDLIHEQISGNKWFKLKYNLLQAKQEQNDTIITFGGAFSNHIAATAAACNLNGLKSIGIIRGEESSANNPTLLLAKQNGMEFLFVNRTEYLQKTDAGYLQRLRYMYPKAYVIPEGGDNNLGKKGCKDILTEQTNYYTHIFCAFGTGTTFNGISESLKSHQSVIGINVLKYVATTHLLNSTIINEYHFGGYAKHTKELLEFKTWFEKNYSIELDYVYTSKLFYAVFDKINKNKFTSENKLLIIHSGGLQGNIGYENRYNLIPKRQVTDPQG